MSDPFWSGSADLDAMGVDARLRLLDTLVRHAPVGIALLDTEYRYRLVNEKLAELNGLPVDGHAGRPVAEVLPHLWDHLRPFYDRVLETGEPVTEVSLSGPPGSPTQDRSWLASYYPIPGPDGQPVGIGVVVSETTESLRAEVELRRMADREREALESLRALVSAIPDFIFTLDREARHVGFHAEEAENLYARPETILGSHVSEVLPADAASLYEEAVESVLASGEPAVFRYALDYGEGDRRVFEARVVPKGTDEVVAIVRDMTEIEALEDQLRQSQKMEAVGRLAGGVAHDFNNLLTVINANSALLPEAPEHERPQLVEEIRRAGERAADLTRKLLLFTRQEVVDPRVIDLNVVVLEAETMLRRLLGPEIVLETELAGDLDPVRADPGQIEHVLVNLCLNARDAMPAGGRIVLATRREDAVARPGSDESPTSHSVLTVRDDGDGMTEVVRQRIFEPFFTTKPPGKGTGLGLSVVFGVVEDTGGWIAVESEPGGGATFDIHLPGTTGPATNGPALSARGLPRGTGTILVVDDDAAVRTVVRRVLTACGYDVVESEDGKAALDRLRDGSFVMDLLVADAVMPGMGGRELVDRMKTLRPEVPALLISGFAPDEAGLRDPDGEVSFLQKPFTPGTLAGRVATLLEGRGS